MRGKSLYSIKYNFWFFYNEQFFSLSGQNIPGITVVLEEVLGDRDPEKPGYGSDSSRHMQLQGTLVGTTVFKYLENSWERRVVFFCCSDVRIVKSGVNSSICFFQMSVRVSNTGVGSLLIPGVQAEAGYIYFRVEI